MKPCRVTAFGLLLLLVLAASGCGARRGVETAPATSEPMVWPSPPAEPRIRYLQAIRGPRDLGIRGTLFGRLADLVFGRPEVGMVRPTGVAERDGVLYVADPGVPALFVFDVPRQRFARVDRVGGAFLVSPVAVTVGPDAVFLADSWLRKVFLIDRKGRLVRVFAADGLERPAALAWDDAAGRLYVADSARHVVAVFDREGARTATWGGRGRGPDEFNYPTHLALDGSGTLLVTDALNFRVQGLDRAGRSLFALGRHGDGSGDLASPKGVAADSRGHVYVVDALFDAVQIFDRKGRLLLGFGERGERPGQFSLPGGIFIGSGDRIYVADAYNRRVQVFDVVPGTD